MFADSPQFPARGRLDKPLLLVLIDTEEEFDWSRPHDRASVGTSSIAAQTRAQAVFDRHGIRPIYCIDYPVAETGYGLLRELHADGKCEIGTHLHPWVSPPHDEPVNNRNSYPGNLPRALEREKLARLTDLIAERFGERPNVYKAGRYGVGPSSTGILEELGYEIDTSVVPRTDFSAEEGPDFRGCGGDPYWFGTDGRLLEIPMTVGFAGGLAEAGNRLHRPLQSPLGLRMHLPGIFSRLGLFERIRLTPEGHSFEEMRRLTQALVGRGQLVFSFTYHSPSLEPGFTPYVRNRADLEGFLAGFDAYFAYFIGELGGMAATPGEIRAALDPSPLARAA